MSQFFGAEYHFANVLGQRRWQCCARPFPHFIAHDVFTPHFYSELDAAFGEVLARGLSEGKEPGRFSRNITNYDAYAVTFDDDMLPPFQVFISREWHDLLAQLAAIPATGEVSGGFHHHLPGSRSGEICNDPTPDRPVKHMLKCADPVPVDGRQGGPSRIRGTHRSGPPNSCVNEAAALPSPQVVLSCRSDRYYGRLRLPPGAPPISRLLTGYKTALFHGHRAPVPAGEGLPSSRRHHLNVPRPVRRTVPRGCASRIYTASMAFAVITAARHCLVP